MRKYIPFLCILALGCADNDLRKFDHDEAFARGSALCLNSSTNLSWLDQLLETAAKGEPLAGPVYAFRYSGGVAIVHQAYVLSCVPCHVYNCSGSVVMIQDQETVREITAGMTNKNMIFSP